MSHERSGLLLVGHGTRSERGQAEFRETAEMLARLAPQTPVVTCFLELAQPTIEQGLADLVAQGARRVIVLPLLLFAAGHAKEDIPAAVRAAAAPYLFLHWQCAAHLGCHERLLRLSSQRYEAACQGQDEVAPQDTLWLMVGRGSRDPSALAEMEQFVERRLRLTPVGQTRTAYLAMAQPSLESVLPQIAELRYRRVVVQPHLLFHGELATTVAAEVATLASHWPQQQWLVAAHLGVADLLAEALLDRFCEAAYGQPETQAPSPSL